MRALLQTLDHGTQYQLAQQYFQKCCSLEYQCQIIEISSAAQQKKSIFAKFSFYIKRGKIFALIKNLIARKVKKASIQKYKNKNKKIEDILSKVKTKQPLRNRKRVKSIKEAKQVIFDFKPDVVLVIGSPFLPKDYFLPGTRYINLHIGKIPEYRGLKCIEWALLKKDYQAVGFTVHELTPRLDFGKIYEFKNIEPRGKTLSQIYAECYKSGIQSAINIAFSKLENHGVLPSTKGTLYYSIDFNGFVIKNVLDEIDC